MNEQVRQARRQHRRQHRRDVGEPFVHAVGRRIPAGLGVAAHDAEYNGVDVGVHVERDHEEAERQRGGLQVAPGRPIEGRRDRAKEAAQEAEDRDQHHDARRDERRREAKEAVPGRQRGPARDEEQQTIGHDDERLEIESLQSLQQSACGEQIRSDCGRDPHQVTEPNQLRVRSQDWRHDDEKRQPDRHPHQLEAEHMPEQAIGRCLLTRDRSDRHLSETDVHNGLDDRRQRQGV